MNYYEQVSEWVQGNPGLAYVIVFLVALVEAFGLTTLILPGTLFCIAFGALVFQGVLHPLPTFLSAYLGTFLGDNVTFAMSRGILSCFDRFPSISDRIKRLSDPIKRRPVRFILFAHLTPYLKGLISLAAPSALEWRRWFRLDAIATLLDTALYLGAGFLAAALLGTLGIAEHFTLVVAVLVSFSLIYWWFKGFSEQHPDYTAASPLLRLRHFIRFVVLYLPWHISRLIDIACVRVHLRARHRLDVGDLGPVTTGDILLVRRHYISPWGFWAHCALVTEASEHEIRCVHAYNGRVREDDFPEFPQRYAMAVVRVDGLSDEQRQSVVDTARGLVGNRFSIFSNHRSQNTSRFSCVSLVARCFLEQGIDLRPDCRRFVLPDEIYTSPSVSVLSVVSNDPEMEQLNPKNPMPNKAAHTNPLPAASPELTDD